MWIILLVSVITLTTVTVEPVTGGILSALVPGVATKFVEILSSDEEMIQDLSAAEEAVKGLPFDLFKEDVDCRVIQGIPDKNFEKMLDRFIARSSLPEDIGSKLKDSLLDILLIEKDIKEIVQRFQFEKGKTGSFVYGRVAVVRRGGFIDMAHSMYQLEFKLSPRVIEHKKKKKFLGFITYGTKTWRETQERELPTKDLKEFEAYFKNKAIAGFKKEYAGLIKSESNEFCSVDSCHTE